MAAPALSDITTRWITLSPWKQRLKPPEIWPVCKTRGRSGLLNHGIARQGVLNVGTEPGIEDLPLPGANQADWFLQYLTVLADDTPELSVGVTLQANGLLVSGHLINEKAYFESIADDIAATSVLNPDDRGKVREIFAPLGSAYSKETGGVPSQQFIHLKNARFFNSSGHPLSATQGFLWRGRISEVKGFSMGTLFPTPMREPHAASTESATDIPLANLDILEYTQDAIFVWEMHGEGILYWNRAAEQLYGYSRSDALGHTSHALLKTQVAGGIPAVEEQLSRYGVWAGRLQHRGREGRMVQVQARLSLLSQRNGRLLVIEVNRDVPPEHNGRAIGEGGPLEVDKD